MKCSVSITQPLLIFSCPPSNNSDYKCGPFIILLHLYCGHICNTFTLCFSPNKFQFVKILLIHSTIVVSPKFTLTRLLYFQRNL